MSKNTDTKTTYGSANAAREAWVETPEETRKVEKTLRQAGGKRKAPKVKTAGDGARTATRKGKAAQETTTPPIAPPTASDATTAATVTEPWLPTEAEFPPPAPEATPTAKPRKARKAAPEPAEPTMPAPGTLAAVAEGYLAAIQANGRSAGTAASYGADLNVALKYLGADTRVADLTETRVREYFQSATVTLTRRDEPKNPITIAKTRRILRLALVWAAEQGIIPTAPIPNIEETPATAKA